MGRTSGTYVTCYVHGDKSPISSVHHSPNIYLKFKATTSRDGTTIKVTLSDMTFKALGGYGYPMSVYAKITTASHTNMSWVKLDKSTATTAVKWTRHPSNKTLSLSNDSNTSVYVHIGAYANDAKHCFPNNPTQIARYTWDVPAANFTLTYNANGGSNAPDPVTVSPGTAVTVASEKPLANLTVNYYMNPPSANLWYTESKKRDFINWNTKADGSGTPYVAGNTITMNSNVTLYAQWKSVSYTINPYRDPLGIDIIFRPQGGTVVPTTNHVSFPQSGYNTSDGVGTTYMPGQTYEFNIMTLDLYPKYSDNHVTIQNVDLPPTLPDSSITRTGYSFEGWYLDEQYNTKIPDLYYTDQNPLYLYAKWKPLPVYKKTETGWEPINPKVWKCVEENGEKVWKPIAHIMVYDGTQWSDLSR